MKPNKRVKSDSLRRRSRAALGVIGEEMRFKHLAAFIFLAPSLGFAGVDSFECTVTAVHAVSQEGEIVNDTDNLKKQIGSTFSVERKSGVIRGGYFINSRASKSIEVINEPQENSYYVITKSHGPYISVGYLYVANHRKWLKKPFTYTGSGEYVYSGYCM